MGSVVDVGNLSVQVKHLSNASKAAKSKLSEIRCNWRLITLNVQVGQVNHEDNRAYNMA